MKNWFDIIPGNHWNPIEGQTSAGLTRHTFWGEVAFQIGGLAGYEAFRQNDEARISPGKGKLREFLEAHQPLVLSSTRFWSTSTGRSTPAPTTNWTSRSAPRPSPSSRS